ncbi:MAG: LUD domain-containing protein, partial [Planctomycetia bacterium]
MTTLATPPTPSETKSRHPSDPLPILAPHEASEYRPADEASAGRFFAEHASEVAADQRQRQVLRKAMVAYDGAVARIKTRFLDHENARRRAALVKRDAIEHLDRYLEQFEKNVVANGGVVHWAETGDDAVRIILDIARRNDVRHVVKG